MTHTLHRRGDVENLKNDYVLFAMSAKGMNEIGSASKLKRFLEIVFEFNPKNAGDMKTGNMFNCTREELLNNVQDVSIVHAVFTDEDTVIKALEAVKKADLGVSVVISGLIDHVKKIGETAGAPRHTVECSGGIWGNLSKLPSNDVLEVTTMCGHGMVAASFVTDLVKQIKRNRITVDEAAKALAGPCVCGIFNPVRAASLLQKMAFGTQEPVAGSD
jgi:hypothetical protein